jgi:hypothetical protein
MGYPRMSKRPRDPSYTEAVRLLSARIRPLEHSEALHGSEYLSARQLSVDLRQAAVWLAAGAQFGG